LILITFSFRGFLKGDKMAESKDFFERLRKKIKPFFGEEGSHDFDHTERVFRLATSIAKEENADLEVVQTAALLHDVARKKEDCGEVECHAEQGAKDAEKILQETDFSQNKISLVVDCIAAHRFSKGIVPKTVEGKILRDADLLDVLGAIGIARVFSYGGARHRPLHSPVKQGKPSGIAHFYEKIMKIKPEEFYTKTAKEIALHRYKFMEDFVKEFLEEWKGKK